MKAFGYRDIERICLDRIQTGEWPPGTRLPSDAELASEFQCARGTVTRAMAELSRSGLVTRKRRAGTRVKLTPLTRATLHIPVIREDVEASGKKHSFALLARDMQNPPAVIRARMNAAADVKMLHLRTLHMADHRPFIYEDRWVNTETVPAILGVDLEKTSANEWLVKNAPLSGGDLFFFARSANKNEASAFGVEKSTPLFIMERITWMGEAAITFVTMAYPPGYQMHMRI